MKEFARTNLWFHPGAQRDLAIQNHESDAELTGRLVADVASMAIGVTEAGTGTGAAAGGILACATGVGCPAVGAEAIVAGGALIAQGTGTTLTAADGLGRSLTMLSNRSDSSSWKVGDPINAPTPNGYPSWSTVQSRYWKNRANNALSGEFSDANIERMKLGLAPIDENGISMELHHINRRNIPDPHNITNLQEVWPWEHDDIDPFRHYRGPRPE